MSFPSWRFASFTTAILVVGYAFASNSQAQSLPLSLISKPIDDTRIVPLRGTTHPMAQSRYDLGAVPDTFRADRILLSLNRPPERQAALGEFLVQVHSPGSPNYHQWVTPEQFGERFGPADADVQAVVGWLVAHGFRVPRITKSKTLIEFSGTAAQFREAFHSQVRQYSIRNRTYYANAADLSIPDALAPLVRGISPTNSFHARPAVRKLGPASYSRAHGTATPLFTLGPQSNFFALAPEDFATEYNLSPLYASGINGQDQTIGIVISSNIDVSLVDDFRQLFNLSANPPQTVIDGGDPGEIQEADTEAYLDAELSGAVAPAATVNLYISNGSDLQDPILLAAVRAVEDNQADVLSLSIAECEAFLGPDGNGIWSRLWEQAAAQGQTVLVASGDGGSAGCDFFDFEAAADRGLAVNGIASTPWDVAVGGTDFYYSDYASGAPSADSLWNATNDSAKGSLKARLPEQVWDEPFGFNVAISTSSITAGGGGISSCALRKESPIGPDTCTGYPKPAWQSAPGVPADGVRDLPDVSLFASSGSNRSAYAICAVQGDCAADVGTEPTVLLVGGTSASAPAMAGIMALVNQKHGRQGQADFSLYALARQQPAVFHDITLGGNNVPCKPGSPNCSLNTDGSGLYSLQEYPAGRGYDLASGLGSVDANDLVSNWSAAKFTPTTTTLTLSPTTFVHGTQVLVNATVAPSQGTGTPIGDIGLVTSGSSQVPQANFFSLSNGSVDSNTFYFPGGTYQVRAVYYGDGSFGASASSPVTLSVSPGPSAIDFTAYAPSGAIANGNTQGDFGYRWVFSAAPYGLTPGGLRLPASATGTVIFTDAATSQSQQVALDSEGTAGWEPSNLSIGTHPITVSYSGDASYQPSTTGPFTVTVVKGTPIVILPEIQTFVPAGGNLHVTALVGSGFGTPPTGNINFSLGNASVSIPLVSTQAVGDTLWATATGTLSNLNVTGSFMLTVTYSGDANWNAATKTNSNPIVVGPSTLLPTSTTLTVSPQSITRLQSASMIATVQGGPGATAAPTGSVIFYADGEGFEGTLQPSGLATATAALAPPVSALSLAGGTNQIVAVYTGDNIYNPSTSAPSTLNVDLSYFSLTLGVPKIVVSSGASSTVPLNLAGIDGFNQSVSLGCTPSSSVLGCAVNPLTPVVSGNTGSTLTVNAFVPQRLGTANPTFPSGRRVLPSGLEVAFAMIFLLGSFTLWNRTMARLRLIAVVALAIGCGATPTTTPPSQPPSNIATPPGAYSVLVTGTAHGTVRNIRLEVTVQ